MEHEEIGPKELEALELKYSTGAHSENAETMKPELVEADVRRLVSEVRWLRGVCEQLSKKVLSELVARTKVIQTLKTVDQQNRQLRVVAQSAHDTTVRLKKEKKDVPDDDGPGPDQVAGGVPR